MTCIQDTVTDFWAEGADGGSPACATWRSNPMYRIRLGNRPNRVPWKLRINLSLTDRRHEEAVFDVPRKYTQVGFTVLHDDPLLNSIVMIAPDSDRSRDTAVGALPRLFTSLTLSL